MAGRVPRRVVRGMLALGVGGLLTGGLPLGAPGASAADLGSSCCADLEERIAELEATTARKGNRKVTLTVSGYVNEAVMSWDDGVEKNAYQVTNEVARSRFRFLGSAKIDTNLTAGYLMEVGVRGSHGGQVSQSQDDAAQGVDVRHSTWWLQHKDFGKIWVGQTSSAADSITELTLSLGANAGTTTHAEITNLVGGFFLRNASAVNPVTQSTLSGLTVTNLTNAAGMGGNPGEGFRYNVVKYETPLIAGFMGSAAWGEDDLWDVALRYAGAHGDFKLAAGIGYQQWSDGNGSVERGCARVNNATSAGTDTSCRELGLSASVMHVPTGLFIAGAYGYRIDDNRPNLDPMLSGSRRKDEFEFVQAGIEKKFAPLGATTLWGEVYRGQFGAAVDNSTVAAGGASAARSAVSLGLTGSVAATDISMWGLGVNQNIEAAALDLYVFYRSYGFDVTSSTGQKSSTNDLQMLTAGARLQF
jgi:hypothetical protein